MLPINKNQSFLVSDLVSRLFDTNYQTFNVNFKDGSWTLELSGWGLRFALEHYQQGGGGGLY